MKAIDLTGQRFGRLTALRREGSSRQGASRWLCQCDCGAQTIVLSYGLRRSRGTKSCGCLSREAAAQRAAQRMFKHGEARGGKSSVEHRTWIDMNYRCFQPRCKYWKYYGGRGITVCAQLHKDNPNGFINFLSDIGRRPSPRHSIDRIDNNGNYSCGHCEECKRNDWPMNCRWATPDIQIRNKRRGGLPIGATGIRGVSQRKNGKYTARIHVNGQRITLGTFDTKEAAARIIGVKEVG